MSTKVPEVLRARGDFEVLQRDGRTRGHPLLSVRSVRNGREGTRFGYSTARRIGTAVVRNRTRRRLREIARRLGPRLAPGWDVLVVARPAATEASATELAEVLERLLRQSGILLEKSDT
ncbi:MAG TPA: ribonuclease P protein component [Candidatus Limnocylindrales bacterium]|nr:ribonuclease P protein component [Candidatus Limnocylindrales bacterium]